jgi:hypothetical protein
MLRDRHYIGYVRFKGKEYSGLISFELFHRVLRNRNHPIRCRYTPPQTRPLSQRCSLVPDWPDAQTNPVLLLDRRGGRLTIRGASTIFRTITQAAGLDDAITAHTGRRTSPPPSSAAAPTS